MSDAVNEALSSVKQDKYDARYRTIIMFVAILGVIIVTFMFFFQRYQASIDKKALSEADSIHGLIGKIDDGNKGEREAAIYALESVSSGHSAYSAVAGFHLARLYMLQDNLAKMIYHYGKIAEEARYPRAFRDYAAISEVSAKIAYGMAKSEDIVYALDGMISDDDFIFRNTALILKASILNDMKKDATSVLNDIISSGAVTEGISGVIGAAKDYNNHIVRSGVANTH